MLFSGAWVLIESRLLMKCLAQYPGKISFENDMEYIQCLFLQTSF